MPTVRRWPLAAFVLYTCALITATHWPGLQVSGPVDRTDLIIHVGAFCVWTLLLASTGLMRGSATRLVVVALVFAVLDETTQPLMDRTFDWLDLVADTGGVLLGALTARVVWRRKHVPERDA